MSEHALSRLKLVLLFDPRERPAGNWYGRVVDTTEYAALRYTLLLGTAGMPPGGGLTVNMTWVERDRDDDPWKVAHDQIGVADADGEGRRVYSGTLLLGPRWGRKRFLRPVLGLNRGPVGVGMYAELVADPAQIAAAMGVEGVRVIVGGAGEGGEGLL